jgi:hypothetical protein
MSSRRARNLTATAVAAISFVFAGAIPAHAAPDWQTYKATSNWTCGDDKAHKVSKNVIFQTCIVKGANRKAQAVLVVSNRGTKDVVLPMAQVHSNGLYGPGIENEVQCGGVFGGAYTLQGGQARACFAPTVPVHCADIIAYGKLWANSAGEDATYNAVARPGC